MSVYGFNTVNFLFSCASCMNVLYLFIHCVQIFEFLSRLYVETNGNGVVDPEGIRGGGGGAGCSNPHPTPFGSKLFHFHREFLERLG